MAACLAHGQGCWLMRRTTNGPTNRSRARLIRLGQFSALGGLGLSPCKVFLPLKYDVSRGGREEEEEKEEETSDGDYMD
jgi:hypothetical protein